MAEELTTLGPAAGGRNGRWPWSAPSPWRLRVALGWSAATACGDFLHAYLLNYCYVLSIALGGCVFVAIATRLPCRLERDRAAALRTARRADALLAILWLPIVVCGPAAGTGRFIPGPIRGQGRRRRRIAGPQGAVLQPGVLRPPLARLFSRLGLAGEVLPLRSVRAGPLGRPGGDVGDGAAAPGRLCCCWPRR